MDVYLDKLSHAIKAEGYSDRYLQTCLTYANNLLTKDLPVIFDKEHVLSLLKLTDKELSKFLFAKNFYYSEFKIPKKSGNFRILNIPSHNLKKIQKWILENILVNINVSEYAKAYKKNVSILDNAKIHTNKECLLHIDIKDFFPSISYMDIYSIFKNSGYSKEVSYILASLCTYNDSLPQGSPASPYLSNIVLNNLDKRLSTLANKSNTNYSRYADDITFSGERGIKSLLPLISKIIHDEGFKVNESKTRIQYSHQRQVITGLIVNNEKVRINKNYKKKLLQEIYYCNKYGPNDHLSRIGSDKSFYKEHLYGKAYYVYMVEPKVGKEILQLLEKINWDY